MEHAESHRRRARALAPCLLAVALTAGCGPSPEGPGSGSGSGSESKADGKGTAGAAFAAPPDMIPIEPGSFERLGQRVTLTRRFWLGRHEVTQGEFMALMGRNPSHFQDGQTQRPVEKVRFADATAYCDARTRVERQAGRLPDGYAYRLPTEAEWEYACRAGTTNVFSFGDAAADPGEHAWTQENSGGQTHPVGLKRPNPWGLHDMHGNVWEWCSDWFGPYPAGALTDPTGPPEGKYKVFRGGSWNHAAEFARSANRFTMSPSNGIHFVGFRVALGTTDPPPPGR